MARIISSGSQSRIRLEGARRLRDVVRGLGVEIRRQREDQGVSQAAIARAAGMSPAHLCGIEAATSTASLAALASVAAALGARLDVRVVPHSGSPLRDHLQAAMVEALMRGLSPVWGRHLEVPVERPVRGVIDIVLVHRERPLVVAVEAQSEIRRLEQQIRWANEKARALANTELVASIFGPEARPVVDSVLLLRSTRSTRELAREFEATLLAAYPASTTDLVAGLATDGAAWPGPGILWARVEGRQGQILPYPPRGVRLGR
jgi:transcriptional regulator with XRE-family HTH domain